MKVVVPYVELHPVTRQVTEPYNPEYVPLVGDDAYRQLMHRLWQEGEPFVIVEHDIIPWPGAIEELFACSCAWGAYSYKLHGGIGIYHGFGCTKITPELMDATPCIWSQPAHWNTLDQRLWFAARAKGLEPHPHRPAVTHLSRRHDGLGTASS
jgi:hypothetical protein